MNDFKGIAVNATDDQLLQAGQERLAYNIFFRTMHCWKIGDVSATKFKEAPPKIQLPLNSVVHILDNFGRIEKGEPIHDTPFLDLPFIRNENFRKYMYHVQEPVTDGILKTPTDYIYRTMQLQRNLEKFKSQNSGKYLIIRNMAQIGERGPFLGIINHNPVFRLFCRGIMPYWRAVNHCLTSVFNVALQMPEKLHYFFIPLAPKIFVKSKFQQTSFRITTGSLIEKTSYQYMLFVHLYNFVNAVCTVPSLFDQIPKDMLSKLNLVFYMGDEFLFWSLQDLITLNERNQIYTKLFNHFNGFVLHGIAKEQAKAISVVDFNDPTDSREQTAINDDQIEKSIADNFCKITASNRSEVLGSSTGQSAETTDALLTKADERDLERLLVSINGVNFNMSTKDMTSLDISDVNELVEKESNDPIDSVTTSEDNPEEDGQDDSPQVYPDEEAVKEFFSPVYQTEEELNSVRLPNDDHTPVESPEQMVKMGEAYMQQLDQKAITTIQKNPILTMAQKERALKMAQSYKTVEFNGIPLAKLITSKVDPRIGPVSDVTNLKDALPDPSMIHSSITDLDQVYLKKMHHRHMAAVAASMAAHGMYLQAIEERVTNTELTQTKDYSFKYKTVHGKQHSINFSMPIIRDDGTFLVNGIRSVMSKQLYNKPIAKISPTRVSLSSNYNKTIVEKLSASSHDFAVYFNNVVNYINSANPKALEVEYGIRKFDGEVDCAYEYMQIAKRYSAIKINHQSQKATSFLYFGDPADRKAVMFEPMRNLTPAQWKEIEAYEKEHKVIFIGMKSGTAAYCPAYYYIDRGSRLIMTGVWEKETFTVPISILDLIQGATGVSYGKQLTEWVDIKILDGKFPVGFLLCYRFGLLTMLRRMNAKYKIVNTRALKNENLKATDVVLRFADNKALVIPRYPLKVSLIFQGLAMFDLKLGAIEEYEHKDIYYRLLMDKKQGNGRTNYLIGIDDTFDMFIDTMTYDRLVQMKEPTTFEGLLIRATEMLVVPYHKEAAAMANHCLRTYERMNAILYNEMTAQFRAFRKQKGSTMPYSINPNAVLQRIIQDQTVMQVEDINPIHDIKINTKLTYLGSGGRTAESFTVADRRYPSDGMGVLSEATVDNANVAITAQASMDPVIGNVYGMISSKAGKPDELDPTQILSVSSLLMPCATQDDGKRANFISVQMSHTMPTKEGTCGRIRTGFETMIAHRCSDIYAYAAQQDGFVLDVDETLKLVKVKYQDGGIRAFSYATQYGECSDMCTEQVQKITVKKGDRFKQHDILRYNPQFFEADFDLNRQVNYKHGYICNVALVENSTTFEDSNAVTEKLSAALEIAPVDVRVLNVPATAVVHDARSIGDHVDLKDPLLVFELADTTDLTGVTTNEFALAYLEKLNRTAPKAKVKGQVVDVRILYACELSDMHPTMLAVINKYNKTKKSVAKYVKDTDSVYQFAGSSQVPVGSKYKGITIDANTVVFQFLIREQLTHHAGDKMVIDSSLKTVSCTVLPVAPVTESGEEIDALFSATSISNRIVNSPILTGITEKVMEKLEQNVIDVYFGK
jgi:hypothetical protein